MIVDRLSKAEIKTLTREHIMDSFLLRGCMAEQKKAGAVQYTAISLKGSDKRLAAIYGSRGGAASLWIKEDAWERLKPDYEPGDIRIEDVSLFQRGFQWAIHFNDHHDTNIEKIVDVAVQVGKERWDRSVKRREDDERRAKARIEKKKEMASRKKDPFA